MPINANLQYFTDDVISRASTQEGVYALWEGQKLIYYGKGVGIYGIRARLQAHKRGDDGPCTKSATAFQEEITFMPAAREAQLLREYFTRFNQLPHCNDVLPRQPR